MSQFRSTNEFSQGADIGASHAEAMLVRFCNDTGVALSDALGDMLENCMYWAARNGWDFDHELARARRNMDDGLPHIVNG